MTQVQNARNWSRTKSRSIDTSAAENFPPPAKHFLPTLYSEEQVSDTEEKETDREKGDLEVDSLKCWIELGSQSQSDFRRGSSPFHMSLMSDVPLAPVVKRNCTRPKLNKRFSSLPDNCPLPEAVVLHDYVGRSKYSGRSSATELLRKRRKQLDSIHKMRVQEEYFDALFEKSHESTTTTITEDTKEEGTYLRTKMAVLRTDKIPTELYDFKEILGSGRFGKVALAVDKQTGEKFAAKQMSYENPKQLKEYEDEVSIMKMLNHPLLLSCKDAFCESDTATLILELVTGGELFEKISDENFDLTETMASKYLIQILKGISYMHTMNVLHLDLKPENILCLSKEKTDQIKIIDFGFARRYDPRKTLKVMFGTPEFVAPEVVNFDALGKGTDIWSIGVIAYIMVSGLSPFMGVNDQETLSNVSLAEFDFDDEVFDEVSNNAKNFIQFLLQPIEKKRPTCKECLKHVWLQNAAEEERREEKKLSAARINLRKFIARRRMQKSINAVRAITRLTSSLKKMSMKSVKLSSETTDVLTTHEAEEKQLDEKN